MAFQGSYDHYNLLDTYKKNYVEFLLDTKIYEKKVNVCFHNMKNSAMRKRIEHFMTNQVVFILEMQGCFPHEINYSNSWDV